MVTNATGARLSSECGIIYFVNDMSKANRDICQDQCGRIIKHLPMSALQDVLTTLQSPLYGNYLVWDLNDGIALYDSIAVQGAAYGDKHSPILAY
jgi:hypothetical protein